MRDREKVGNIRVWDGEAEIKGMDGRWGVRGVALFTSNDICFLFVHFLFHFLSSPVG